MLFANNCNTTLSSSLTNVATTLSVTSATGFPSPTGSQYFYCTLADAATQTTIEIVKVTAVSGTTFTIVRGQDGTTGTIFASGAVVSLRLVRANLNDFPKLDEDNTFAGTITFSTPLLATNMVQSTTSTSGYLTSTDWNTFNGKGTGTVTSVAATVPAFLSISGSPITTSGTLAITLSGTALPTANGGTGLTSPGASGAFLISNGTSWYANVAPACRAYTTGNTSCAVNTATKIILNNKTFDTNNNFDATTNYRFTPTVAGYYLLTGALTFFSYTATYTNLFFEKNGSATGPVGSGYNAGSGGVSFTTSDVVYLNGSTDYVEMYAVQGTATLNATNGFFSAVMVRGA